MSKLLKPRFALSGVAIGLVLILLWGVSSHLISVSSGKEVLITARGYDPRAFLLGHYVRVQPELEAELTPPISTEISKAFALKKEDYGKYEKAWTVLERKEDEWVVVNVVKDRPDLNDDSGQVAIFCDVRLRNPRDNTDNLTVSPILGINRYYANRAEALRVEEAIRSGTDDVKLILSVSGSGQALLKGVQINSERIEVSWW